MEDKKNTAEELLEALDLDLKNMAQKQMMPSTRLLRK